MKLKDEVMDGLAETGANVAQFVSYDPTGKQRFARVCGVEANFQFASIEDAVNAIHKTQYEKNVNIRTFLPEKPDGNPFLYGPKLGFHDPAKVVENLKRLLAEGYYAIINETIDEADGGFSGVLFGDLFEFASRDIPRCVEKPGCASLPRTLAQDLIRAVYGFEFHVPYSPEFRVECSVHPGRVGYLGQRQVVWQAEAMPDSMPQTPQISWPNRYSKDMGDKAFGLLIAHLLGFSVPVTHVFGGVIPYFAFGFGTRKWDGREAWLRTCPHEQVPGKFATTKGWGSPARMLKREDPTGEYLASVILQEGIRAKYSGAAITDAKGKLIMEGKAGHGDTFMVGKAKAEVLPRVVTDAIADLHCRLHDKLGDVRFEWVYDGNEAWLVQLHVGRSKSHGDVIYEGSPEKWVTFKLSLGLEKLRALIPVVKKSGNGIILVGDVGVTAHPCDLLRRDMIPSKLKRP